MQAIAYGEHIVLHNDDLKAVNTEENPDNVAPKTGGNSKVDGGVLQQFWRKRAGT